MGVANIIAVDGPAASGKSTLGKLLAEKLGYLYFDTGLMYRAVTWLAIQEEIDFADENAITALAEESAIDVSPSKGGSGFGYEVMAAGEIVTLEIRSQAVDENVSVVSTYSGVRKALTAKQRQIAMRGRVVMVGRDIGTVVLPEADLKIFLDASVEVRAQRRYKELVARGERAELDKIKNAMKKRDRIDSSRQIAPLRPAYDAVILDSDNMDAREVLDKVLSLSYENLKEK